MSLAINELAGGGKTFPFDEIGDKVKGKISLIERRQQRSFESGTPLTWDDGTPRMLTYIEIQTDLRDGDDDDGVRSIYAKGGSNFEVGEGSGLSAENALFQAAKDAGCKSLDEGGTLAVAFTGRSKPTVRGYQPAKLFTMKYEAPVSSVAADDLFD